MLTGKYRRGEKGRAEGLGGRVFQAEDSQQRTAILDAVLEIAQQLGTTADRVAIAWAGSHRAIPMPGPRSLAQLESNLQATSLDLTSEQIARLDAVSATDPAGPASRRAPGAWTAGEITPGVVA